MFNATTSIDQAEKLKQELTDKYVTVADGVSELRRFANRVGRVKTVNMNCRALVEFDGPADIGWYDIDPTYLTVVEPPAKAKKTEAKAAPAKEAPPKATEKPAAKPAEAGKKLSPLELARQQGAFTGDQPKAEAAAPAKPAPAKAAAPAEKPKPAPKPVAPAAPTKAVELPSDPAARTQAILALCRQQGAFKG